MINDFSVWYKIKCLHSGVFLGLPLGLAALGSLIFLGLPTGLACASSGSKVLGGLPILRPFLVSATVAGVPVLNNNERGT